MPPKVDAATRRKRRQAVNARNYRERQRQKVAAEPGEPLPETNPVKSFLTIAMKWAAKQESPMARALGMTAAAQLDALPETDREDALVRMARLLDVPVVAADDDAFTSTARGILVEVRASMAAGTATTADVRAGLTAAKRLAAHRPKVDSDAVDVAWARALLGEEPPAWLTDDDEPEDVYTEDEA